MLSSIQPIVLIVGFWLKPPNFPLTPTVLGGSWKFQLKHFLLYFGKELIHNYE
jgi:hypothetical protein